MTAGEFTLEHHPLNRMLLLAPIGIIVAHSIVEILSGPLWLIHRAITTIISLAHLLFVSIILAMRTACQLFKDWRRLLLLASVIVKISPRWHRSITRHDLKLLHSFLELLERSCAIFPSL